MDPNKVESKPTGADSKPNQGSRGFLPDTLPQEKLDLIEKGRAAAPDVQVRERIGAEAPITQTEEKAEEQPKTEPTEESQDDSKSEEDFSEVLKLEGGKEVRVEDLARKAKYYVPVGDDDHELTYDQLIAHAGRGIQSAQLNQRMKQAMAEADKTVGEVRKELEETKARIGESVQGELSRLLESVVKNIDPSTGKPFGSEQEKGDAETLLRGMQSLHAKGGKKEPEVQPVDVKKEVAEALKAERERMAKEQAQTTAKGIWEDATRPYMQKFLKADGKTVNKTAFGLFQNAVAEEAGRLAEVSGKRLDLNSGKEIMAQAIKNMIPMFRTSEKKTEVVEKQEPVPLVKPTGGSAPYSPAKTGGKSFQSQEALWDSRFGG